MGMIVAMCVLLVSFVVIGLVSQKTDRQAFRVDGDVAEGCDSSCDNGRDYRRVYVIRGRSSYSTLKIGYSARRGIDRLAEPEQKSRMPLEVIAEIECNYAWHLEQEIHRVLRKNDFVKSLHRRARFGNEWYRVPVSGQASLILMIEDVARHHARNNRNFRWRLVVYSSALQKWIDAARSRHAELCSEKSKCYYYFEIDNPSGRKLK